MTHGRHVKILGEAPAERLRDAKDIAEFLEHIVAHLGMRILSEPHMYEVEEEIAKLGIEPFEDEGGVTGIAVLSTSHCAIHTWPLRGFFVLDVFSCRNFDADELKQEVEIGMGATRLQMTDLSFALQWDETPTWRPSER